MVTVTAVRVPNQSLWSAKTEPRWISN